ncbi:sulfatase [Flammeovirgaceae bacterium SG7u.111]|nr:sulfatase [Flammeovirgaceae bacterium SG7u.132]WPO36055.1 sulfatase [Flammeovirgaceae bacterium SG7u.111]
MRIFSLMLTILPLLVSCGSAPKSEKLPNIVLINVDDLGWKDVGFMGSTYYETPHLDAFAREGMVFTNAYAGAANCAPSRACLLSGLNTPRHGVYTVSPSDRGNEKTRKLIPIKNTKHLQDSIYTLPQMLKSAGYVTGSFGKWHVGEDPNEQGIDYNIGGSGRGNPGKGGYFAPYNIDFIENGPEGEYLTDRLTQEAISFFENNKDTTFFAYIPFYTVHTPLMGKEELVEKYKPKTGVDGQDNPTFGAMVSAMDENVGRIFQALEALSLSKNTLVIFTSDNGGIRDISYQNPLRAGKGSYYEGGIRVPLVIRWPGKVLEGTTNGSNVSNLDFYATLQELANPKKKAQMLDGISLVPQFQDTSYVERDVYFHFPIYLQAYNKKDDGGRDPLFRTRPGSVVIAGDWKLHQYFEDGGLELYNLKTDVGETTNMAEENPEIVQRLLGKLDNWRQRTGAPVPTEQNGKYDPLYEKSQIEKVLQKGK